MRCTEEHNIWLTEVTKTILNKHPRRAADGDDEFDTVPDIEIGNTETQIYDSKTRPNKQTERQSKIKVEQQSLVLGLKALQKERSTKVADDVDISHA